MKYWDKAWSLVEGCSPVSLACENCWLAGMEYRFDRIPGLLQVVNGVRQPKFSGNIICHPDRLDIPLKTKKPTVFAVWSDLFHHSVPSDFIIEAFERMSVCHGQEILTKDGKKTYSKHTFLVFTKRPERINSVLYGQEGNFYLGGGDYMENVWLGTTTENQAMADLRISELLKCKPFKLFLSAEPLLENIDIRGALGFSYYDDEYETDRDVPPVDQVICGCESGPRARPTKIEWVEDLRKQCLRAGVPLWVKQLKIDGRMVYNHPLSTIQREDLWHAVNREE